MLYFQMMHIPGCSNLTAARLVIFDLNNYCQRKYGLQTRLTVQNFLQSLEKDAIFYGFSISRARNELILTANGEPNADLRPRKRLRIMTKSEINRRAAFVVDIPEEDEETSDQDASKNDAGQKDQSRIDHAECALKNRTEETVNNAVQLNTHESKSAEDTEKFGAIVARTETRLIELMEKIDQIQADVAQQVKTMQDLFTVVANTTRRMQCESMENMRFVADFAAGTNDAVAALLTQSSKAIQKSQQPF